MEKSIYAKAFKQSQSLFKLFGSKMLVERLDMGDIKISKDSDLILATPKHAKSNVKSLEPLVCKVLATGEGYTLDDGSTAPLSIEAGNIVVLNANGVSFFSTLPGIATYSKMLVGITTESDVQLVFASEADFDAYVDCMQEVVEDGNK